MYELKLTIVVLNLTILIKQFNRNEKGAKNMQKIVRRYKHSFIDG
jgi:hypothetical protein